MFNTDTTVWRDETARKAHGVTLNLLYAIRTIQGADRRNTRCYISQRYDNPATRSPNCKTCSSIYARKELERLGYTIASTLGWQFRRKQRLRFNVTNRIVPTQRFRYFIEVPELA